MASEDDLEKKSIEALKAELSHLRKEMWPVKEELRKLREKAWEYRDKRDELNQQVKALSNEIRDKRLERDELNEEVRLQKAVRQALWEKVQDLVRQLRELLVDMPRSLTKKQSFLARREKELDWRLQTTPLSLSRERDLVQEIAAIEEQLEDIRKYQKRQTEIDSIKQKISQLRKEADETHRKVKMTADKAQAIHETMVEHLRKIDEARKAADQFHENFINEMQKIAVQSASIDEKQARYNRILAEIRKRDRSEYEQRRRNERRKVDDIRKRKIGDAEQKLKTGGKLTFEEFFLLKQSEMEAESSEKE
ncbi:MAG: coiled-coil protein [Candidatus Ranarchaeia archaeon]